MTIVNPLFRAGDGVCECLVSELKMSLRRISALILSLVFCRHLITISSDIHLNLAAYCTAAIKPPSFLQQMHKRCAIRKPLHFSWLNCYLLLG